MRKLLVFLLLCACNGPTPPPPPAPISVFATKAKKCNVPSFYDYIGHVEAYNTVSLVPQVQGYLTHTYVEEGQEVRTGDLLMTIDPRPYQAVLAKNEALLAQNIATLKYAKDTVHRYSRLVKDDFVSQLDFDNYVTNVLSNEAVIKQNLADIESAKLNLEFCYLRAPMNAVIGVQRVDDGNFITAGTQNPLAVLNQIQPIYISFYIPENDLARVRQRHAAAPLTVEVFLEGTSTTPYHGSLTMIDNQVDQDTGSILLRATLDNKDKALWPGQFVSIRLILEQIQGAILVPTQAVQLGQTGYYTFVIGADHKAELRQVTKGDSLGEWVVIRTGIQEGEVVVTEGQVNLLPGATVAIRDAVVPTWNTGTPP